MRPAGVTGRMFKKPTPEMYVAPTRSSEMNIAPWINYKWYNKWID